MIRDIIRQGKQKLVCVEPDAKVSEVAQEMQKNDVGCVLVLTNGRPRGLITDRDIVVRCVARNLDVNDTTVENVMSESPECCNETDGVFEVIRKMRDSGVRRMPVVDQNGDAVGVISFGDLLRILAKELGTLVESTTREEPKTVKERLKTAA